MAMAPQARQVLFLFVPSALAIFALIHATKGEPDLKSP